mmetsp:Transcript_27595/g.79628  ORF Transcript_27595/g.79628 Transcript_27595/m.79628 type:complete len:211 (-) Transcript_27595:2882-3514(-)
MFLLSLKKKMTTILVPELAESNFSERIPRRGVISARTTIQRPSLSTRTFLTSLLRSPLLCWACQQKKWSGRRLRMSASMEETGKPTIPRLMLRHQKLTKVPQTHLRRPTIVVPRMTAITNKAATTKRTRTRRITSCKCYWRKNFPNATIVPRSMQSQKSSAAIMLRARRPGSVFLVLSSSSLGSVWIFYRTTLGLLPSWIVSFPTYLRRW